MDDRVYKIAVKLSQEPNSVDVAQKYGKFVGLGDSRQVSREWVCVQLVSAVH
jgi:hypothetical protein